MVVTETLVLVINTLMLRISLTDVRILTPASVLLRISVYTNVTLRELGLFFATFRNEITFSVRGFSLDPSVPEGKGEFFPSKHRESLNH